MIEKRQSRPLALLVGICPMALLASCGTVPAPATGHLTPQAVPELGQVEFSSDLAATYALRPNDVISLTVFREPDLSADRLQIAADGTISVPLLGVIVASGKTPAQLAEVVRQGLSPNYVKYPNVGVNVIEYASHQITVEGAVTTAGLFTFKPGTRLSGAIALAGGLSRVAKMRQVVIFRPDTGGMTVAKFDYAAMSAGTMIDPVLMPNDRIIVGTSGLSQFYQDLLKALPAFAVFTRL
jgi:polysaccharide export outer membrane protein